MTNKPTLRSQAHLQGTQSLTQSKPCKRASLRQRTGSTLLFLLLALLTVHINAQPAIPRPVFQNFQTINLPNSNIKQNSYGNPFQQQTDAFQTNTLPMGATAADVMQKVNQNAMWVMGNNYRTTFL